ncbi:MAG TPA: hypothetical protein VKX45_21315 [Bryobacteraceae bacterium]|jgi:hypothetical protein|nr:hypothetical protein [Bryobacteraceae bacterium]
MLARLAPLLLALAWAGVAQKYDGPRPPKPDLPYLKHASNLLPTEAAEAKEQKEKSDTLYVVEGAGSPVRTPLASPIFLFVSSKIVPEKLGLYRLDVKGGHREILFGPKKQPRPILIEVKHLDGNLYRLEVSDSLEPGEYSLSPEGSNQVFCFAVF